MFKGKFRKREGRKQPVLPCDAEKVKSGWQLHIHNLENTCSGAGRERMEPLAQPILRRPPAGAHCMGSPLLNASYDIYSISGGGPLGVTR